MDEAELNRRRAVCMVHGWVYEGGRGHVSHTVSNSKGANLARGYERGAHWVVKGAMGNKFMGKPLLYSFDGAVGRLIAGGHAHE